jgi:hypothetical protein
MMSREGREVNKVKKSFLHRPRGLRATFWFGTAAADIRGSYADVLMPLLSLGVETWRGYRLADIHGKKNRIA